MTTNVDDPAGPRSVLVTGGSSGIGRAVVEAFCALGDRVVVLDQAPPKDALPAGTEVVLGDVTSFADNRRAVDTAFEKFGALDVLVANAGIHDGGPGVRDLPADDLVEVVRRVLDVDVLGYVLAAKAACDALVESRGSMVFTLSDAAYVVRGNGAGIAYTAAKHAGLGLVRHLASDLAPHVRVNAVAPGGIITGLQAAAPKAQTREVFDEPDAIRAGVRELNPLGVVLTPEQLAGCYTFLASPAAVGLTGEVLRPDGGLDVR